MSEAPKRCIGGKPGHAKWAITGSEYCASHGGRVPNSNARQLITPPTGELLPAEDRLANVLKAIEDRLTMERDILHHDEENGITEDQYLTRREFIQGLDIAWSIAQSETLRRTDSTW